MEHETAGMLAGLATALEESALGRAARGSRWLYPLASVLHVLGVGLLLGAIAAFDLRVLGRLRALPLAQAGRLLLPVAATGLALQLASGPVMLAADATHLLANPLMRVKLLLVGAALLNVALFHGIGRRLLAEVPDMPFPPAPLRACALLSLAAWLAIAALGRMVAYV